MNALFKQVLDHLHGSEIIDVVVSLYGLSRIPRSFHIYPYNMKTVCKFLAMQNPNFYFILGKKCISCNKDTKIYYRRSPGKGECTHCVCLHRRILTSEGINQMRNVLEKLKYQGDMNIEVSTPEL